MRVSKKWLNDTFLSFYGFCLAKNMRFRPRKRAGTDPLRRASGRQNPQSTETSGFSSVLTHTPPGGLLLPLRGNSPCVVRAGLNIRGCGPLSTPGFFDWFGFTGGKTPHTPGFPGHCQCSRSERRGHSRNSRTRRSFRRPWRICGICRRRWRSIPWRTAPRRFH